MNPSPEEEWNLSDQAEYRVTVVFSRKAASAPKREPLSLRFLHDKAVPIWQVALVPA